MILNIVDVGGNASKNNIIILPYNNDFLEGITGYLINKNYASATVVSNNLQGGTGIWTVLQKF
jgi:hypothetical protein